MWAQSLGKESRKKRGNPTVALLPIAKSNPSVSKLDLFCTLVFAAVLYTVFSQPRSFANSLKLFQQPICLLSPKLPKKSSHYPFSFPLLPGISCHIWHSWSWSKLSFNIATAVLILPTVLPSRPLTFKTRRLASLCNLSLAALASATKFL